MSYAMYNTAEISKYDADDLYRMLDGASYPESMTSPGAEFLLDIRDRVVSAVAERTDTKEIESSEIADSAVPIPTHERWQVFVDLALYHYEGQMEDPPELTTDGVGTVLFYAADDLTGQLLGQAEQDYKDLENEDEEEEDDEEEETDDDTE